MSKVCELSGGAVERIDPANLSRDMANMMKSALVAANVECKFLIHKGLRFRNELDKDVSKDKSTQVRRFGNV